MNLNLAKQRTEAATAAKQLVNIVGECYVEYHIKMERVHDNAGEVVQEN